MLTWPGTMVEAAFVDRPNRFVVRVRMGARTHRAHLANSGRLGEFLAPGTPFLVRERRGAKAGMTRWSVVAARDPTTPARTWVILDTGAANGLVAAGIEWAGLAGLFEAGSTVTREPRDAAGSRFDLAVETGTGPVLVEVKSVSLLAPDGATGLFPDAPTERGARQVERMATLAREGRRCVVLFLALRADVRRVRPNSGADPAFAAALQEAAAAGVALHAWGASFDGRSARLTRELPLLLEGRPARGASIAVSASRVAAASTRGRGAPGLEGIARRKPRGRAG